MGDFSTLNITFFSVHSISFYHNFMDSMPNFLQFFTIYVIEYKFSSKISILCNTMQTLTIANNKGKPNPSAFLQYVHWHKANLYSNLQCKSIASCCIGTNWSSISSSWHKCPLVCYSHYCLFEFWLSTAAYDTDRANRAIFFHH